MKLTKDTWNELGMKQGKEQEDKKDNLQKAYELLNFLRKAFCISESIEVVNPKNLKISGAFKMVDSKRGIFYIGILKQMEIKK